MEHKLKPFALLSIKMYTLNQGQGIHEASGDKLKCFYSYVGEDEQMLGFEDKLSTKHQRIPIMIENEPLSIDGGIRKNYGIKSLKNSPSKFICNKS